MQSKATTVSQYLAELPPERRAPMEKVRATIRANLDPLYQEGMQYGMIGYYVPHAIYPPGYHCDPRQPLPFVHLASQKNYMSLYLGCVYGCPENERWFHEAWARTGKKLDMGKACLRFKKVEDLALDVIGEVIRRTPVRVHIEHFEAALQKSASRRSARARATSKKEPTKAGKKSSVV